MGNNQSFEPAVCHPRFSKVQFATDSLAMLVREPIISNQRLVEPWTQKHKLYDHIYHSNDIIRHREYQVEHTGTCSDSCLLIARFQDKYVTSLKQQIQERQQKQLLYTEEQVWNLLLIIARCASEVYSYGDKHFIGNIHPYNILINRKEEFKILVTNFSFSLPGQRDHFEEYRIHGDSQAFVSPQLLGFLASTKYAEYPAYPRCVDKQTAEAFSLGMTLLSVCTLQTQLMKCYKPQNILLQIPLSQSLVRSKYVPNSIDNVNPLNTIFKNVESIESPRKIQGKTGKMSYFDLFNNSFLEGLLTKLKERYSTTLYQIILSLIHPDPQMRMKADRLYRQYLVRIEKNILAFDKRWLNLAESANMESINHSRDPSFSIKKENNVQLERN